MILQSKISAFQVHFPALHFDLIRKKTVEVDFQSKVCILVWLYKTVTDDYLQGNTSRAANPVFS